MTDPYLKRFFRSSRYLAMIGMLATAPLAGGPAEAAASTTGVSASEPGETGISDRVQKWSENLTREYKSADEIRQRQCALFIHFDSYKNWNDLDYPRFQAGAVKDALEEEYGYFKYSADEDIIKSRNDFLNVIGEFGRITTNCSRMVFYYAGHSFVDNKNDDQKKEFFIALPPSPKVREEEELSDDCKKRAPCLDQFVPGASLAEELEKIQNPPENGGVWKKQLAIFLDSCRSSLLSDKALEIHRKGKLDEVQPLYYMAEANEIMRGAAKEIPVRVLFSASTIGAENVPDKGHFSKNLAKILSDGERISAKNLWNKLYEEGIKTEPGRLSKELTARLSNVPGFKKFVTNYDLMKNKLIDLRCKGVFPEKEYADFVRKNASYTLDDIINPTLFAKLRNEVCSGQAYYRDYLTPDYEDDNDIPDDVDFVFESINLTHIVSQNEPMSASSRNDAQEAPNDHNEKEGQSTDVQLESDEAKSDVASEEGGVEVATLSPPGEDAQQAESGAGNDVSTPTANVTQAPDPLIAPLPKDADLNSLTIQAGSWPNGALALSPGGCFFVQGIQDAMLLWHIPSQRVVQKAVSSTVRGEVFQEAVWSADGSTVSALTEKGHLVQWRASGFEDGCAKGVHNNVSLREIYASTEAYGEPGDNRMVAFGYPEMESVAFVAGHRAYVLARKGGAPIWLSNWNWRAWGNGSGDISRPATITTPKAFRAILETMLSLTAESERSDLFKALWEPIPLELPGIKDLSANETQTPSDNNEKADLLGTSEARTATDIAVSERYQVIAVAAAVPPSLTAKDVLLFDLKNFQPLRSGGSLGDGFDELRAKISKTSEWFDIKTKYQLVEIDFLETRDKEILIGFTEGGQVLEFDPAGRVFRFVDSEQEFYVSDQSAITTQYGLPLQVGSSRIIYELSPLLETKIDFSGSGSTVARNPGLLIPRTSGLSSRRLALFRTVLNGYKLPTGVGITRFNETREYQTVSPVPTYEQLSGSYLPPIGSFDGVETQGGIAVLTPGIRSAAVAFSIPTMAGSFSGPGLRTETPIARAALSHSLAFANNGSELWIGGSDGRIRLFDLGSFQEKGSWKIGSSPITAIRPVDGKEWVVAGLRNRTGNQDNRNVVVFDPSENKVISEYSVEGVPYEFSAFYDHAAGKTWIGALVLDGATYLIQVGSNEEPAVLFENQEGTTTLTNKLSAAFSGDGRHFLALQQAYRGGPRPIKKYSLVGPKKEMGRPSPGVAINFEDGSSGDLSRPRDRRLRGSGLRSQTPVTTFLGNGAFRKDYGAENGQLTIIKELAGKNEAPRLKIGMHEYLPRVPRGAIEAFDFANGFVAVSDTSGRIAIVAVDSGREIGAFRFLENRGWMSVKQDKNGLKIQGTRDALERTAFLYDGRVVEPEVTVFEPAARPTANVGPDLKEGNAGSGAESGHSQGQPEISPQTSNETDGEFNDLTVYLQKGHSRPITAVAVHQKGVLGASGDESGEIRIWEMTKGRLYRSLQGHKGRINALEFSPDGSVLVSASDDLTVRIWDPRTGDEIQRINAFAKIPTTALAFEPSGRTLFTGDERGNVGAWQIDEGRWRDKHVAKKKPFLIRTLAAAGDGKKIVAGGDGPFLKVLEFNNNGFADPVFMSHGAASVHSMKIDGTGKQALIGANDGMFLLDIPTGSRILPLHVSEGKVRSLAYLKGLYPKLLELSSGLRSTIKRYGKTETEKAYQEQNPSGASPSIDLLSFVRAGPISPDRLSAAIADPYDNGDAIYVSENGGLKITKISKDAFSSFDVPSQVYREITGIGSANGRNELHVSFSNGKTAVWHLEEGQVPSMTWLPSNSSRWVSGTHAPLGALRAMAHRDGTVELARDGERVATLASFEDGGWIALTRRGYFAGSEGVESHLNIRKGDKIFHPALRSDASALIQGYRAPSLVATILSGLPILTPKSPEDQFSTVLANTTGLGFKMRVAERFGDLKELKTFDEAIGASRVIREKTKIGQSVCKIHFSCSVSQGSSIVTVTFAPKGKTDSVWEWRYSFADEALYQYRVKLHPDGSLNAVGDVDAVLGPRTYLDGKRGKFFSAVIVPPAFPTVVMAYLGASGSRSNAGATDGEPNSGVDCAGSKKSECMREAQRILFDKRWYQGLYSRTQFCDGVFGGQTRMAQEFFNKRGPGIKIDLKNDLERSLFRLRKLDSSMPGPSANDNAEQSGNAKARSTSVYFKGRFADRDLKARLMQELGSDWREAAGEANADLVLEAGAYTSSDMMYRGGRPPEQAEIAMSLNGFKKDAPERAIKISASTLRPVFPRESKIYKGALAEARNEVAHKLALKITEALR